MWSADIDALLIRARSGEDAAQTELIQAVQKDLQVFIAAYALDQAMVDTVFAASWAEGSLVLTEAIRPAAEPQAGLWMGRAPASEPGEALAKRIRDLAVERLRLGLATADQQAVSVQDTLLHLIAQAALESLPVESANDPAIPQLIRDRLRMLPPSANGLLAKRYGEAQTPAQIAAGQGRKPAELAAAMAMARSAVDWQARGAMYFDPGDSEFPLLIEAFIDGTLAYDARLRLAESLLRDIGRNAGFIRQVRLDLVLTAYSQAPRAPERPPPSEPPRQRTSTRLTMPANGIPATQDLHRPSPGTGRMAKGAPGTSPVRLVLIACGALVVLAVIAGGIGLSTKAPTVHPPAAARDGGTATSPANAPASAPRSADANLPAPAGVVPPAPAEPASAPAPARASAPPLSGAAVAHLTSGQATVTRAGGRYALKAGAALAAGEALETDAGPAVLALNAGDSLTIGVNSLLRTLELGSGQSEVARLERGQLHLDGAAGAHAVGVGVGRAVAVGNGAAFTVTTTDDGMRLEVAQGSASILRSGLPPVVVRDHRVAVVHEPGAITVESSGTPVAAIKLGGPGVVADGRRWKSQQQAQHDGMTVIHCTAVAASSLRDTDPALRSLLDPAVADAHLDLALPDGTYDVVAWIVGQPGSDCGQLSPGGSVADNAQPEIGPRGWLRLEPIRATASGGHLDISYAGQRQQFLAGLELIAIVTAPQPPSVVLTAPGADVVITAPATLVLAADAVAPLSAISTVEFLVDGVRLGEVATAPYTLPWTVPTPGVHLITANVIARNRLAGSSLPITVTVSAKAPAALLLTAAEESAAPAGATGVVLTASGDHLDGAVASVEFLSDGTRIGEAAAAPFILHWGKAAPGEHRITALAHLASGGTVAGGPLSVMVQRPVQAPVTVAIESPEDGSELAESSHLTIRAKAASREGRVTRVDYVADEQKVGESTVAPFTYIWTKATPGLHRLRAIASDDHGASATSEMVSVLLGRNAPFVLARGIHLGGGALEIDGFRWLAQDEALARGLGVKGGKAAGELAVAAPSSADPGLAALLGAGLVADGDEMVLRQSLPNGFYQISLWLSEAKGAAAPAPELELQGLRQTLPAGRMGRSAWAKYGPFTAHVANQELTVVLHAGHGAAAPRLHGLAISVPLAGGAPAPRPLVELLFDAVNGALTPNTGLSASISPTATISADGPQRSAIISPAGGSGSMDFGKTFRPAAIDVPGLAPALRGLKSFTLSAWLNNRVGEENGGGDRIISWSHDGGDGAELVYHNDGSVQLAVNSLVDGTGAARRSSPGLITSDGGAALDNWRFIAVTYDATQAAKQVRYYVGTGTDRVYLDSAVDLARGAVGMNPAAELTIGHTYPSFRKPGADRMFRGVIDQVRIWGSASDGSGALTPEQIIAVQAAANPGALRATVDHSDPVVAAGLVAWFQAGAVTATMGGGIASWEDLSGKHHDLAQGAPAQRPLLIEVPGTRGSAIACTGEQDLEINGVAGLDPETFTLMAWLRQDRFPSGGDTRRWAVGKNGNETEAGHFSLFTANGVARAYLNLGGDIKMLELASPPGSLHEHAWHLLAMTYDGERLTLSLDGTRVGEVQAHAKRTPGIGAFVVGRRPDHFGAWDGLVDEVRLYDRALGDAEIQSIERATRARYFETSVLGVPAAPGAGPAPASAPGAAAAGVVRTVMLWDGDSASGGAGWSTPGGTSIVVQDAVACHGTHALRIHVSGSNFANSGWNWRGWQANTLADDATLHGAVILALKVDGTAKPTNLRAVLRSPRPEDRNTSVNSEFIDLLPFCPTLVDGAWHDVAIPIAAITSKNPGFDLHHLFELSIYLSAPGAMESDVYVDDVGYGGKP